ncbi:hypothetical protein [Treponema parvum]|uniref:hypothetical protein n=1 Tax=Treponema parvum TaxID=138851 RepID=UPI001AEC3CA9|nr:hypothetical protein [Treponema parvum]QTQ16667.1 hypothetical protein HXT04_08170 [Treponema parvum]
MQNKLTGIERELVLKYLQDGNVPVTVTLLEDLPLSSVHSASSAVFPVALQPEKMTVLDQGIILLKNPPQAASSFEGKDVRVEFYFNRLGLCFITKMTHVSSGLALAIPSEINRITEVPVDKISTFKADIHYLTDNKKDVHIFCSSADGYKLFSKPIWSDIPSDRSGDAKKYLESFVGDAKKQKEVGNGVYLIPVCRYLVERQGGFKPIQSRRESLKVLYVDHECIVLGGDIKEFPLKKDIEYSAVLSFPVDIKPASAREVETLFVVRTVYSADDGVRRCAVCRFTSMKEEDIRFVYEMTTKNLLI